MRRKLADNLKRIRDRIQSACARAGRRVEDVRLVAVTKSVEIDVIRSSIELGLTDLGESRPQELVKRAGMIREHLSRRRTLEPGHAPPDPRWHMIGHLQRNKVRMILPWVEMIHSVDSLRLADEIHDESQRIGRIIPVLLEVNVSGEKSKFGIAVGAVAHVIEHIRDLSGLHIRGLMTMAPLSENPDAARPFFARLRELLEELRSERLVGADCRELSMGMSNDFEAGILEGATLIRVGSALYDGVAQEVASRTGDEG
ncbi:MAG: YggS family pyridoxal phosphate-dependent enzyme [Phycisphaerae bacterium]